MKRTIIFFTTILVLCISQASLPALHAKTAWRNVTSGIDETEFNAVSVSYKDHELAYVATSGGVYKTKDAGLNWKKSLYLGASGKSANFVIIRPDDTEIVYAATDKGVYRTTNGGKDWRRIFNGVDRKRIINHIALHPTNPSVLFIGTKGGLFITNDFGKNWQRAAGKLGKSGIYQVAFHPEDPKIIYAICDKGLYKSRDHGRMWENVFSYINSLDEDSFYDDESDILSPGLRTIAIDIANPSDIYLGTEEGIFKSSDNGEAWHKFTDEGLLSRNINFLSVSPLAPHELYAATEEGLFVFSKEAEAWDDISEPLQRIEVIFVACDMDRQNSVWVAAETGVYKTSSELNGCDEARFKAHEIFSSFNDEPTVREIQEAAINYAEVHPDKIARWRRAVKRKALFPKLSFGIDKSKSDTYEIYTSSSNQYYTLGPDDETEGWDINLSWDLGNLIWNSSQTTIDIRSKLMVQLRDDILDEVTRYYFERRKLQIELLEAPPEDVRARTRKDLRLQELTANIDALTGGYLSENLE